MFLLKANFVLFRRICDGLEGKNPQPPWPIFLYVLEINHASRMLMTALLLCLQWLFWKSGFVSLSTHWRLVTCFARWLVPWTLILWCIFLKLTPSYSCLLLFCFFRWYICLCLICIEWEDSIFSFCKSVCVCVLKCNLTRVLADNAGKFDLLLNVKAVCIAVLNGQHFFFVTVALLGFAHDFCFLFRCYQWWMVSPILCQLWLTASTLHHMVLNISQKIDVRQYFNIGVFCVFLPGLVEN